MYDPHAKDLKEWKRLRKIWEPLPSRPGSSTWESEPSAILDNDKAYTSSEHDFDYLRVIGTDRVTPSDDNSNKMGDFWMLPNGQAVPSGSLSNTLTPFSWSYNHWSLIDTANVSCQDQNHLPLMQTSLENDTSDSLSTSVMAIHVSDNDSTTVTTSDALPQADISLLNDAEVTDNKYHWLTDSIAFIRCNPFYALECALKEQYLVLKIENIPWVISIDDIKREFDRYLQPSSAELDQNIHIMMDISSGKTDSKAFLQIVDCNYNHKLLEKDTKGRILHCRRIKWSICPQDEFLRALYPRWPGTFQDGKAILPANNEVHPVFITQRELQSLGIICRNYKIHFNRKSGERPFYFMKSLILNLPWNQEHTITTAQRDILYESYKIMARYLTDHSTKQHTPFDADATGKFVRPSLQCCGFTPKQRRSILHEANVGCPPELAYSIQDPVLPQDTTE